MIPPRHNHCRIAFVILLMFIGMSDLLAIVGCRPQAGSEQVIAIEPPETKKLKQAVDSLSDEDFGVVRLGTPHPYRSRNVDYIIQVGRPSIPLLVEALKSGDNVKVGYAAFCLHELNAPEGLVIARQRTIEIRACEDKLYRKAFALNCLQDYLDAVR
jgi:hypothetical protein